MDAVLSELAQQGIDACTLNNALNVAQLAVLLALMKWTRTPSGDS